MKRPRLTPIERQMARLRAALLAEIAKREACQAREAEALAARNANRRKVA